MCCGNVKGFVYLTKLKFINASYTLKKGKIFDFDKGAACKTVRSENERYNVGCIFVSKYTAIHL